jgi:hypothetical protein
MTSWAGAIKRRGVNALRRLVLRRPILAAWLVAMALMMKMLVPAGFMPSATGGFMTVQLCTGMGPQTVTMALPGKAGEHDGQDQHGKVDQPCAFSGLAAPTLAAADAVLLAAAIAFILAAAFMPAAPPMAVRRAFLRPPLRGPPGIA